MWADPKEIFFQEKRWGEGESVVRDVAAVTAGEESLQEREEKLEAKRQVGPDAKASVW